MKISAYPLSGALGAIVSGVKLPSISNTGSVKQIRDLLLEYGVIFFKSQQLSEQQQIDFARQFGNLNIDKFVKAPDGFPEIMPVIREAEDSSGFAGMWHSDVTFLQRPAMGSILYAKEVPPVGGDTLFSNMYLAYESLSTGLQNMLRQLSAVHCASVTYFRDRMDDANQRSSGMKYTSHDPNLEIATHPVVRTHPETGKKALFVNSAYTRCFAGMTEQESRPLLEFLFHHLSRPEFTCRFHWEENALAFWDNRCVQHCPINDFSGHRREMRRVTISGDAPYL